MKNRIPPPSDHLDIERPSISNPNLVLTVDLSGWLKFQWVTPGCIFYSEKYHVDTYKRVGWNVGCEPSEN